MKRKLVIEQKWNKNRIQNNEKKKKKHFYKINNKKIRMICKIVSVEKPMCQNSIKSTKRKKEVDFTL